jgi:adenylate cyclase
MAVQADRPQPRMVIVSERLQSRANLARRSVHDILPLRLRALMARAHGDAAAYAHCRDRYRKVATELDFEGHMAMANAMP